MRLFIAVELPDQHKTALGRLRVDLPGTRWVPVEQLHLTLSFLGEVEENSLECLYKGLARIQVPAFQLCFSKTGCFPDQRRPRVLWVGIEPEPLLSELVGKVRSTVLQCGIPQEEREFSAHITLARVKTDTFSGIDSFPGQTEKLHIPPFHVQEFILFKSQLTPQGAVHSPVRNFLLTAP